MSRPVLREAGGEIPLVYSPRILESLTALSKDFRRSFTLRVELTLTRLTSTEVSYRLKKGDGVGKTKIGKGTKIMAIADQHGIPVALGIHSATPHEVTLVEATIENRFLGIEFKVIVGDAAYDSDGLDTRLARKGIELIAPNNPRRKTKTQDGRPLQRMRRRWHVECLFAWLKQFRRVATRYERRLQHYRSIVLIACASILYRRLPEA